MRFSLCYRIVRLKGFFWGRRLFLYQRKFAGYLAPSGTGLQPRRWLWALGDGFWARSGYHSRVRRSSYPLARLRNSGYALFRQLSPRLEPFWPSAWAVLRYLYIRHQRGRRYRLGLPARGQRTHSNAATTRRIRNVIVAYVKTRYWGARLWEARKKKTPVTRSKTKYAKKASKADKGRAKPVRSKKNKKDIWR